MCVAHNFTGRMKQSSVAGLERVSREGVGRWHQMLQDVTGLAKHFAFPPKSNG